MPDTYTASARRRIEAPETMKRPRVELNAEQAGLNAAFAGLNIPNLPEAPKSSEGEPLPFQSAPTTAPKSIKGRVILRRETAHRGGKAVVIVHDFDSRISAKQIEELGRRLRAACGCGGTVRDREIELQGEQAARTRELLEKEGFRVAGVK